jgi:hypothetical protein
VDDVRIVFWVGVVLGLLLGACLGVLVAGLLASAGREDERMEVEGRMLELLKTHHHERIGPCPVCPPEWENVR